MNLKNNFQIQKLEVKFQGLIKHQKIPMNSFPSPSLLKNPIFKINFWKGESTCNGNGIAYGVIGGYLFRKYFQIRIWTKKIGNGDTGCNTMTNKV